MSTNLIEINIAMAADSNYMVPITVALQSLFAHRGPQERIRIYLLHMEHSLTEANLLELTSFADVNGVILIPLPIKEHLLDGFPTTRHGKSTLLRLMLPNELPHIDKILYLDGDIVVEDSLTELYKTSLKDCYVAASKDSAGVYNISYQEAMGISASHTYFNAGVTLLNLKALRQIDLMDEINRFVDRNYSRMAAPDQDFLNYICQGRTKYIHPRYNMNYMLEKDVASKVWGKAAIKEAKAKPAVIHYIGPVKPWSTLCIHPKRRRWWDYLNQTSYAYFEPKDDTLKNRLRKGYLWVAKQIESQLTLADKQKLGKLMPDGLKKRFKKSLLKPSKL